MRVRWQPTCYYGVLIRSPACLSIRKDLPMVKQGLNRPPSQPSVIPPPNPHRHLLSRRHDKGWSNGGQTGCDWPYFRGSYGVRSNKQGAREKRQHGFFLIRNETTYHSARLATLRRTLFSSKIGARRVGRGGDTVGEEPKTSTRQAMHDLAL